MSPTSPSTFSPVDYFSFPFYLSFLLFDESNVVLFLANFDLWPTRLHRLPQELFVQRLNFRTINHWVSEDCLHLVPSPWCSVPKTQAPLKSQFAKHKLHPRGQSKHRWKQSCRNTAEMLLAHRLLSQRAKINRRSLVAQSGSCNTATNQTKQKQIVLTFRKHWLRKTTESDDYEFFDLHNYLLKLPHVNDNHFKCL